jgi:polysaccharide export outer membrane protein
MVISRTFALAALLLLSACGTIPGNGPPGMSVNSEDVAKKKDVSYLLEDLNPTVVEIAGKYRSDDIGRRFGVPSAARTQVIGVGDTLSINIWEAGPNGLFSTTDAKATTIAASVDESGSIFVPYVGRMRAAGATVESLRIGIQEALADKAIQPQVQVAVTTNLTNSFVILGDVTTSGRLPITANGMRLLDAIAAAGGSKTPTFDTTVVLKRGNEQGQALIDDVYEVPSNNVVIKADDSILLVHSPRTFTVFGAVNKIELFPFDQRSVTLAEALARAGGLAVEWADPSGVFLFRYEESTIARRLAPDSPLIEPGYKTPVVYRLDLREPSGFFLARHFELQDKDLVYIANHPMADFGLFLKIINPALQSGTKIFDTYNKFND